MLRRWQSSPLDAARGRNAKSPLLQCGYGLFGFHGARCTDARRWIAEPERCGVREEDSEGAEAPALIPRRREQRKLGGCARCGSLPRVDVRRDSHGALT